MSSPTYFVEQLERQLRFLEISCREYDSGNRDEAIRIATALRVMFHQTNNSMSLLHHLGATTINVLSTCPKRLLNHSNGFWPGFVQVSITIGPPSVVCSPNLDTLSGIHRYVPFSYWWDTEMVLFAVGRKFKRKQLVLDAANKDGGAHVDCTLAPNYKCLLEGEYLTFSVKPPGGAEMKYPTRYAHVAALRQIAHEVLNSPDLMQLAGRGKKWEGEEMVSVHFFEH